MLKKTPQCLTSHKDTRNRYVKFATRGLQPAGQLITGNFRENKSITYFSFKIMTEKNVISLSGEYKK